MNVKFLHEKMKIDVLSEEMRKIAESAKRKMVKIKIKFASYAKKCSFLPSKILSSFVARRKSENVRLPHISAAMVLAAMFVLCCLLFSAAVFLENFPASPSNSQHSSVVVSSLVSFLFMRIRMKMSERENEDFRQ